MNILVTGGAGFIGSHLCDALVREGHFVTCLDDFSSGSIWNIRQLLDSKNFRLANGDIRNRQALERAMDDAEIVFHLAAQIHVDKSYTEPELTYDVNVRGTQNVLELARWHRVGRVVYASSSEVYGEAQYSPMDESHPLDAPHPYGASKVAADRMCFSYAKTYGMDIFICRFFNIYGPRQKDFGYGGVTSLFMRRSILGQPLIIFGDGSQTRDLTYVSDAIAFYMLALKEPIGAMPVNIGTGEEHTIRELADRINTMCCAGKSLIMFAKSRPSEVSRLIANATYARSFGWKPEYDLDTGLEALYEWFMANGTDH